MRIRKKIIRRVKTHMLQVLESIADRIHPKNNSGNNVSRF